MKSITWTQACEEGFDALMPIGVVEREKLVGVNSIILRTQREDGTFMTRTIPLAFYQTTNRKLCDWEDGFDLAVALDLAVQEVEPLGAIVP